MKILNFFICMSVLVFLSSCSPKISASNKTKITECFMQLRKILLEVKLQLHSNQKAVNIDEILTSMNEQDGNLFTDKKKQIAYAVNPNITKWKTKPPLSKEIAVCCKINYYPKSYNINYLGVCFDGRLVKLENPPNWYKPVRGKNSSESNSDGQ